jgi:hypothetical protein
MRWQDAAGTGGRHIYYNAYGPAGNWEHGTDGKSISLTNGGYTTIDVTNWGAAVGGWHQGAVPSAYHSYASRDYNQPLGFFEEGDDGASPDPSPATNCEGWVTGTEEDGNYIWPVIDWDFSVQTQ